MNIIKAIKSGKYFKRESDKDWFLGVSNAVMQGIQAYKIITQANTIYIEKIFLKVEDILAEDWEIKTNNTLKNFSAFLKEGQYDKI